MEGLNKKRMRGCSSKENVSPNLPSPAQLLHNSQRHRSIVRDHLSRQARRESLLRKTLEEEAMEREAAIKKLKEEKRTLYEKFLKNQRSNSAKKNDKVEKRENVSTLKPLPPRKQAVKKELAQEPKGENAILKGLNERLKMKDIEDSLDHFEMTEKMFLKTEEQPLDANQLAVEKELEKLLSIENETAQEPKRIPEQKPKPLIPIKAKPQIREEEAVPQTLINEIQTENETELQNSFCKSQKESQKETSSLKSSLRFHISNGRKIEKENTKIVNSDLDRIEQELLKSIEELNAKSLKLTAEKPKPLETPAMKSDEIHRKLPKNDPLSLLDSLQKLDEELAKEKSTLNSEHPASHIPIENPHTFSQTQNICPNSMKPLSQIGETQSYSMISDISSIVRMDNCKFSYAKSMMKKKEAEKVAVSKTISMQDTQQISDGVNKMVFDPKKLKELIKN